MRHAIDIKKIPQGRPSPEQVKLNKWKINEMKLIGLVEPYDSDSTYEKNGDGGKGELVLTQFGSLKEYSRAKLEALKMLRNFEPIPEPLRTKLILETRNLKKQSGERYY